MPIEVPRDRQGSFQPQIVPKHARRITGFDEAIVSLYAKGLTTGEIQAGMSTVVVLPPGLTLIQAGPWVSWK